MSKKPAYFDNSATTAVAPEVLDEMMSFMTTEYGNPSSIHSMGDSATKAIALSRKRMSSALGCKPSEIIFTSGGTESDNIAIFGVAERTGKRKMITTSVEHSAVLEPMSRLRARGFEIVKLPVNGEGFVDQNDLLNAIDENTALVSVMAANNVIGTLEPIYELSKISHDFGALFHTDAVQAFTKTDLNVKGSCIDLISLSSHKIHGPKGVGSLYVKGGTPISPITFGGGQEANMRPSTENVPGIVGMGKATDIAILGREKDTRKMSELRDRIMNAVLCIGGIHLNGPVQKRLCNNVHVCVDGVKGMDLVLALSKKDIFISTTSACSAGSTEPSHVMTAIGRSPAQAMSGVRISLSKYNTEEDVERLISEFESAVRSLRV